MAASYTAERKAATTSAGTPYTLTPASNCTTGSTLLLLVAGGASTGAAVTSVSDTAGNTWHIDNSFFNVTAGVLATCSSYQTVGLTTSDTITVNGANVINGNWLEEFAGNYSVVDGVASVLTSGSTTVGTGTTATTTAADEIAVCVVVSGSATVFTKNASYTLFTTGSQTVGSFAMDAWFRILTATGTQNGNGTASAMVTSNGMITTYKAGAAPPPVGIPDVGMALTVT